MPLRHSKPAQPRSTLDRTRSSQGSPAAAISSTPPCASRVWTPRSAIFTTRPSIPSSATTRFEPPPSTRSRRPRPRAQSRAWSTAASLQASTKNRAGPPTPSVQCSARWTFSSGVILLENMASEEIEVGRAERARGLDELALTQRERLAPHDPRVGDPTRHAEHENDVRKARAEDGEHGDGQHEDGERELDVAQAHQRVVRPAAVIAGEQPEADAQHAGDHDGREADDQGD